MSVQAARDFIDRAYKDESVRNAGRDRYSEITTVGKEHGFDFTRDEFTQAIKERKKPGYEGEEDGGVDPDTCFCCV